MSNKNSTRRTKFKKDWQSSYDWVSHVRNDGGLADVRQHSKTEKH